LSIDFTKYWFWQNRLYVRTYVRPFMFVDVKCLTSLKVQDIHVVIKIGVSADKCHMTVALAQMFNTLSWRVLLSSPLNSYSIQLIAGSENFTSVRHLKALRELRWAVYVNVGEFWGTGGFVIYDETANNNQNKVNKENYAGK